MKLYTEEQVKKILYHTRSTYSMLIRTEYDVLNNIVTPIELPSDDEIEESAINKIKVPDGGYDIHDYTSFIQDGFIEGAIWLKEQILNQNK